MVTIQGDVWVITSGEKFLTLTPQQALQLRLELSLYWPYKSWCPTCRSTVWVTSEEEDRCSRCFRIVNIEGELS